MVARRDEVGVVNGLAWTSVGGEMLQAEVAVVPGTGKIEVTGNLGTVMQESAKAAVTFVRSRAERLGISPTFYKEMDMHIHFPERRFQGSALGRCDDYHCADFGADWCAGASRCRNDRRGHAARQSVADWRTA